VAGVRQARQAGRTRHSALAVGMCRVDYVRLLVGDDRVRAELVGVGYRLPTAREVPLAYATGLIREGTPSVAHDLRHTAPTPDTTTPAPDTTTPAPEAV
jgi:hypothetical protein